MSRYDDPKRYTPGTPDVALAREAAARAAGDAAVLPFKCGNDTLSGGACQFIPGYDLTVGTYAVFVFRQTSGSSPGHLFSDPTSWTATKVTVSSTDPADDADFWWLVVKRT